MIKGNKRLEGESFDNYKARLKDEQNILKTYKRGVMIWNSKVQGTYVRKIHGKLEREN
jgi:hypothetical protein